MNKITIENPSVDTPQFTSPISSQNTLLADQIHSSSSVHQEYLRFSAILSQVSLLEDSSDRRDALDNFLVEEDITSDDEEEDYVQTDSLSLSRGKSSKKNSLFHGEYLKDLRPVEAKPRFGSFLSESSHPRDSQVTNKRVSLFDTVREANAKKRNSDINGMKISKPVLTQNHTRKTMFELIKKSSLKIGSDISIIKSIENISQRSSSSNLSPALT